MADNLSLDEVVKKITKKWGDIVTTNTEALEENTVYSLGSPSLDYTLYGGLLSGRLYEFCGAEGSGKSTTAAMVAASYQRLEIERNPENPRGIIYLDNESTLDSDWTIKMGYDLNNSAVKTYVIRPEAQSAEEIFDMALDMLKTGEIGLMIFDSISTLVPQQIFDESMEKMQMGGIAKALTRFANTSIGLLRKYNCTLIAINQVRDNLGGYGPSLSTPGGHAWKHACSARCMFKRGAFFDAEYNQLTTSAESPAGHIIEMAVLKNKISKWDRKVGFAHLSYTRGVDVLYDTIDVALRLGLIDNSVQGTFKLLDIETGEVIVDANNEPIKIRGKKNLYDFFVDHTEEWKQLYDMIYTKMSQKEDNFSMLFTEMLKDSDVVEHFSEEIAEGIE